MEELLVLVNDNDEEIGYEEKGETHAKGKLHRAFSLFIYNNRFLFIINLMGRC